MTVAEPVEREQRVVRSSYSGLGQHRQCPQKWYYNRILKLERVPGDSPRVELEFGNWWHALMAADSIVRGRAHGSLRCAPERITTVDGGPEFASDGIVPDQVLESAGRWWQSLHPEVKQEWESRIGEGLLPRLLHVYKGWLEEWADEREQERPLAVELAWERELPGRSGTRLIGYIDEVLLDERRGAVVIRDHKSSKALGAQSSLADMMDSQLQLYAWGASPTVSGWGCGPIIATAYDRVRMVRPKLPWITKAGTLSKQVTDFDRRTYAAGVGVAVGGRDRTPLKYDPDPAVLEQLSSPAARSVWFQRTLTPLNLNVVRAHLRAAMDTALDASLTRKRALRDGEAARNLSSDCTYCDFAALCRAQMMGGPRGEYPLADYGLREKSGSGAPR